MFRKMNPLYFVVTALMIATLLLSACAPQAAAPDELAPAATESAAKPFRVGLIVATGGLGDRSFNDSGYAGVKRAADELGHRVRLC